MGKSSSKMTRQCSFELRGDETPKDKLKAIMTYIGEEKLFDELKERQFDDDLTTFMEEIGQLELSGNLNDFYDNLTDSQAEALIKWYEQNATDEN
ncbi:UNKNOWN [Stylonychia lemnae]|uniref:Uncharacterized protein n=1 Tax=Stylonychia lemnae TaxID=5949 RepID=A0A077ZRW9_STYLE|nr:UNKNOWN [Stylonychia lemnae]|eukprot:CDW71231.1 UNKNOWN [Stylonychia lemnae]